MWPVHQFSQLLEKSKYQLYVSVIALHADLSVKAPS